MKLATQINFLKINKFNFALKAPTVSIAIFTFLFFHLPTHGKTKNSDRMLQRVKQIIENFEKEKYDTVKRDAKSLFSDTDYSDIGHWYFALSSRNQSFRELLEKQNYSKVRNYAQEAETHLLKLATSHAYSIYTRWVFRETALAQIIIGASWCKQSHFASCFKSMEIGIQRLNANSELGWLKADFLKIFVDSCKKSETEFCRLWIQKLGQFYPRGSPEFRIIQQVFPDLTEKLLYSPVTKLTQPYKSPDYDQLAVESLLGLFFERKFGEVRKTHLSFEEEYPKSPFRFRARYWTGRGFQETNDKEDANKIFQSIASESPLGFYGLLSNFYLGLASQDTFKTPMEAPTITPNLQQLSPAEVFRLRRAEKFILHNLKELASIELKGLRPRDSFSNELIIYLIHMTNLAGAYSTSFAMIQEMIHRGWDNINSSWTLKAVFPIVYLDKIENIAKELTVDPILILSLIKQESAFDPQAVSTSGALGLMQLMPFTAIEVDSEIQRTEIPVIENNLRLGVRYFLKLLNRFRGNIALALAAYNAGPNAVDRWLNHETAKKGLLEFIENIPYRETREYVSTILRNYYWYTYLIKGESLQNFERFWKVNPTATPTAPSPEMGS